MPFFKLGLLLLFFLILMGMNSGILSGKLFIIVIAIIAVFAILSIKDNFIKWKENFFNPTGEGFKKEFLTSISLSAFLIGVVIVMFIFII